MTAAKRATPARIIEALRARPAGAPGATSRDLQRELGMGTSQNVGGCLARLERRGVVYRDRTHRALRWFLTDPLSSVPAGELAAPRSQSTAQRHAEILDLAARSPGGITACDVAEAFSLSRTYASVLLGQLRDAQRVDEVANAQRFGPSSRGRKEKAWTIPDRARHPEQRGQGETADATQDAEQVQTASPAPANPEAAPATVPEFDVGQLIDAIRNSTWKPHRPSPCCASGTNQAVYVTQAEAAQRQRAAAQALDGMVLAASIDLRLAPSQPRTHLIAQILVGALGEVIRAQIIADLTTWAERLDASIAPRSKAAAPPRDPGASETPEAHTRAQVLRDVARWLGDTTPRLDTADGIPTDIPGEEAK